MAVIDFAGADGQRGHVYAVAGEGVFAARSPAAGRVAPCFLRVHQRIAHQKIPPFPLGAAPILPGPDNLARLQSALDELHVERLNG
jgi:hypothetical protein